MTSSNPFPDSPTDLPERRLSAFDATAIVLGIVVGSGIFFLPWLVAANSPGPWSMLGFWLLGGVVAFLGALCYAELSTAYPDTGGDYYFIRKAFGPSFGFLFVWARMTVIQTGAMAAAAFVGGAYLTEIAQLGPYSSAVYASLIVVVLTGVNLIGLQQGKNTQNVLTTTIGIGLLLVAFAGLAAGLGLVGGAVEIAAPEATEEDPRSFFAMMGLAMIFVLYTYGGWNEAAYLSAEIKNPQRNIVRALLYGIGAVTAIYLLVNVAFLAGLGFGGMQQPGVVAARLLERVAGETGAVLISLLVVVAVVSTVNASVITGARSNHALGRDYPRVFGFLGKWRGKGNVPTVALLMQGGVTLGLIALASFAMQGKDSVEAMVSYTAPAFWLFFFLAGLSLIVLRRRDPDRPRTFRVPLYPLTPLLFCGVCLYMLYSAVAYVPTGSLLSVGVLLAGVPFLLASRSGKEGRGSSGSLPE